ncbi:MAG: 4Fe-4S binding protein [Flavobacteriales bacterium]|nr:4Fe-4S binding protein [Flavobacteriales bacterium]
MNAKTLRYARITLSVVLFTLITLYFIDFAGFIPNHHIPSVQFIPALLSGFWIAVAAIILITLIFGRIYCSSLCPLGVMMDIVSHISGKGKKENFKNVNKRFSYAPAHNILRYGILVFTALVYFTGNAFIVIMALDPYSNYGRIATNIFYPLYSSLNNALALALDLLGVHALYQVSFASFSWAAFGASMAILLIVGIMAYTKGRLWCNTLCPVGAFLSIISHFSLFKVKIDTDKCTGCGICTMSCKSQCIDRNTKTVDNSRCVTCFNCLGGCKGHGITYSFSPWWEKEKKEKSITQNTDKKSESPKDTSRREFLATSVAIAISAPLAMAGIKKSSEKMCALANECHNGKTCSFDRTCFVELEKLPVCPAGSLSIEEFNNTCTACNLCISKCPSKALVPSTTQYGLIGFMQPVMRYRDGHFCAYDCNVCADVCPVDAIKPITVEQKHHIQIGVAHFFPNKCVAVKHGYDCGACAEHCPVGAVHMVIDKNGVPVPEITPELCVGCGACEQICPENAIVVYGHAVHKRATIPVKEEAKDVQLDDFGF